MITWLPFGSSCGRAAVNGEPLECGVRRKLFDSMLLPNIS